MNRALLLSLFLLLLPAVLFCQDGLKPWGHEVLALNKFKPSFELALNREDAKQMDDLWRKLGTGTKNKMYTGTFGKIGYEGGYLLRISSENEFILIPYFDQDMVADYSYGTVSEKNTGEIVFQPKKDLRGTDVGKKRTPLVWVPVMDGRFIVPKEEMKLFGNFYGGFGAYNGFPRKTLCDGCGTFAQRLDRLSVDSSDKHVAPNKYLRFVRRPIEGSIISVGRRFFATRTDFAGIPERSSVTRVRINVGSLSGVRRGLMFFPMALGDNFYQVLRVTRAYKKTSDAELVRQIDGSGHEVYDGEYSEATGGRVKISYPPIKVGVKITTSPIVNNPLTDLKQ